MFVGNYTDGFVYTIGYFVCSGIREIFFLMRDKRKLASVSADFADMSRYRDKEDKKIVALAAADCEFVA